MSQPPKHDQQWAKAKEVCRLNMEAIAMAKALGMTPKSLMKNQPSPQQRWKLPVKLWIRELYEKRFGRASAAKPPAKPAAKPEELVEEDALDENVPF